MVQMNTPRVAMQEAKKALKKLVKTGDLQSAAQSLFALKGLGMGMASVILAAAAPDKGIIQTLHLQEMSFYDAESFPKSLRHALGTLCTAVQDCANQIRRLNSLA